MPTFLKPICGKRTCARSICSLPCWTRQAGACDTYGERTCECQPGPGRPARCEFILCGSFRSDALDATIDGANLYKSDLHSALLQRASLKKTDLREANLENSNLTMANLGESYLVSTNLNNARLKNADLSKAILTDASLEKIRFKRRASSGGGSCKARTWAGQTCRAPIFAARKG